MGVVIGPAKTQTLGMSAVAVNLTGTTSETAMATINLPAGIMGLNGQVRITTYWTITGSANNKTLRTRFGTISGTAYSAQIQTANTNLKIATVIANRNSASSQFGDDGNGSGGWAPSTAAWTTSAIDTSASTTIVISGQLALGSETITLEAYTCELMLP